jgi:carboxypeptidase Q
VHRQSLKIRPDTVIAEIHGREKPDDYVVLGARLPANSSPNTAADDACNAALVLEAARDIHSTGLRPLRSIRFVLFGGGHEQLLGSYSYVTANHAGLDHAIAAAIFERGCSQVTGFSLGGRRDTEPGVREAFAVAPIDSWKIANITYDAPWGADNFDFLLQGVPTLLTNRQGVGAASPGDPTQPGAAAESGLDTLKHNAAIAGVLVFALAEHPAPLGPRLSRAEIASILEKSGLDAAMKTAGVWRLWESGKRGRQ